MSFMDRPPDDHGSDRYDYIQIEAPEGTPLPSWLTADWMPCEDCRANAFLRWAGDNTTATSDQNWHVTIAHDDGCPSERFRR